MKNFFLIFFTLALFACSNKDKLPDGVLPKQKMQQILWDLIKAGEFLNGFVLYKDSAVNKIAESQKWYDKIYQVHKISKKDFDRSFAYYQDHPLLMKTILDSLSKKQVPFKIPGQGNLKTIDSIRKQVVPPVIDTQKKIIDSLRKRRILKKRNYKVV